MAKISYKPPRAVTPALPKSAEAKTSEPPKTADLIKNETLSIRRAQSEYFDERTIDRLEQLGMKGDPAGKLSILGKVPGDGVIDAQDKAEIADGIIKTLGTTYGLRGALDAYHQRYGGLFHDPAIKAKYPEHPEHPGLHSLGEVEYLGEKRTMFAGEYQEPSGRIYTVVLEQKPDGTLSQFDGPRPPTPVYEETAADIAIQVAVTPVAAVWVLLGLIGLGVKAVIP